MTQLQQQLKTLAHWRGSEKTADAVRQEIARRWGDDEAKQYDPLTNCFTIQTWNKLGYRVKKGEKAIRSITYVEGSDQTETGNEDIERGCGGRSRGSDIPQNSLSVLPDTG
jgi:hypothetical protein